MVTRTRLSITYTYLLLFQSAPQPLWVLTYSTVVEYSQQEGFDVITSLVSIEYGVYGCES
jgi:hypothetical protein